MGKDNPDAFGRQAEEVRKIFGDLEIIEATTDFVVYVNAYEQKHSKRGDPNKCMFSEACKRAFGSKGVLFYPTVAYVDMIDPKDPTRRIVMRFRLPAETRRRLEDFDMGEGDVREATFVLKAVPKSQTLAHQRKVSRKRMRAVRQQQLLNPDADKTESQKRRHEAAKKGHQTRRSKALMGVRDGSGGVHTRTA